MNVLSAVALQAAYQVRMSRLEATHTCLMQVWEVTRLQYLTALIVRPYSLRDPFWNGTSG